MLDGLGPYDVIALFNQSAVLLIAAAFAFARTGRRLVGIILLNYLIYFLGTWLMTTQVGSHLYTNPPGSLYYVVQAAREVIIFAFLLDALIQDRHSRRGYLCYLLVILISMTANVSLSIAVITEDPDTAIAAGNGFRLVHFYIMQAIPLCEVLIAWLASDNFLSRRLVPNRANRVQA
ncbi:hypothetical protein [Gallaecimonas sp. GXIMD4217]|uniref:hypothetical protein n=1 Tax=Gallaecimonas sp. GXIMD4217 TaxID=3131927 RepID=UPI00311B3974